MNTIAQQAENSVLNCLWVPNRVLPERYHDTREGGRTLARINKVYNRTVAKRVAREELKAEKMRRAELYRQQLEGSGEIEYQVDEHKLYRNQLAFVGGMVNSGLIDPDELD